MTRGRLKREKGQKKSYQEPVLQMRKESEMKGTETKDEGDMGQESVDFRNLLLNLASSGKAN